MLHISKMEEVVEKIKRRLRYFFIDPRREEEAYTKYALSFALLFSYL